MNLIEAMMNGYMIDHDKYYIMSTIVNREEGMEEPMDAIKDANKLNVVEDLQDICLRIDAQASEITYEKKGIVKLACETMQVEKYDEMPN